MSHIAGVDRNQLVLFPEALDEYISEDNPIRFVDAFVDSLDLATLGFQRAVPSDTGRPPYHPGDLLKLFVYGYLNRLRSSRLLEKEAGRNIELMWLLRKLIPDFKTIADFRKDNRQAIRNVCRLFTLYCRELGLFGGELVAIDGSKFKAVNRRDRNFTERKLKRTLKEIDAKIEEYLQELERNDEQEPEVIKPSAEDIQEKIQALKTRKAEYGSLLGRMAEQENHQISLTDPDSRSMTVGKTGKTEVGYNVQFSVEPNTN